MTVACWQAKLSVKDFSGLPTILTIGSRYAVEIISFLTSSVVLGDESSCEDSLIRSLIRSPVTIGLLVQSDEVSALASITRRGQRRGQGLASEEA